MNDTFWIAWKAAVPVLAIVVVALLIERRWLHRDADQVEIELGAQCSHVSRIPRHRDEATCPCSEVKSAQDRIAYLTERNQQLVFDALLNNVGRYIKINRN
jgi:hypothetical protein